MPFASVKDIYRLAKLGKTKISINKPGWKYVRTDEPGYEMELVACEPLNKFFVIPKDRRSTGIVIDQGCEYAEVFNGDSLYPYLSADEIEQGSSDEVFYTLAQNQFAEIGGEAIKVSSVISWPFPDNRDANYKSFSTWLMYAYPDIWSSYDEGFGVPSFFKKNHWNGNGAKLVKDDLCLTKSELLKLLGIKNSPLLPITKKQRSSVIKINRALLVLNKSPQVLDRSNLLGQMKELIEEYYAQEPQIQELKKDLELAGLQIDRKTLSKYFNRLYT